MSSSRLLTFACLNDPGKVSDLALEMWARILRAVPDSRLILYARGTRDRQRAIQSLSAAGVDSRRVEFVGLLPIGDYLKQYQNIDIALDPTPWCGGTTTCDALWMGVPVVSLAGQTAISRGGFSILSQIGLADLVARSAEEYVSIAASLAGNAPRLTLLRKTLRQRMRLSPLVDAPGFARDFESKLRQMWIQWCERATTTRPTSG
jgi:protein O-GlcNAc transferase